MTRGNALATAATTANQLAVATVVDGLAVNQGLPRPLTMLFPEETKHYGNPGAAAFMWERRADVHALGYCTPDCIDLGAD